jgi:hypothetical protein
MVGVNDTEAFSTILSAVNYQVNYSRAVISGSIGWNRIIALLYRLRESSAPQRSHPEVDVHDIKSRITVNSYQMLNLL